jgi:hypothetical protein
MMMSSGADQNSGISSDLENLSENTLRRGGGCSPTQTTFCSAAEDIIISASVNSGRFSVNSYRPPYR